VAEGGAGAHLRPATWPARCAAVAAGGPGAGHRDRAPAGRELAVDRPAAGWDAARVPRCGASRRVFGAAAPGDRPGLARARAWPAAARRPLRGGRARRHQPRARAGR